MEQYDHEVTRNTLKEDSLFTEGLQEQDLKKNPVKI